MKSTEIREQILPEQVEAEAKDYSGLCIDQTRTGPGEDLKLLVIQRNKETDNHQGKDDRQEPTWR